MIDLVKLKLSAGNGGDGRISLLREKYRPKGGPDGGSGGDGGNVIIRGNKNLNTLKNFAGAKEFHAESGQMGGKNKKHGIKGEDIVLEVPLGTVIWLVAENQVSQLRRKRFQKPVVDFEFDQPENQLSDQADQDNNSLSQPLDQTNQPSNSFPQSPDQANQDNNSLPQSSQHDSSTSQSNPKELSFNQAKHEELFRLNVLFQIEDVEFAKYFKDLDGNTTSDQSENIISLINPTQEDAEIKQFSRFDKVLDNHEPQLTALSLVEITEHGQEEVICQGGFGGRGNYTFRSSVNQTPLEAEHGTYGEQKEIIFELRLLADLGLVGLPNAGKSTLLSRLTKAKPKIANYPFTTLEPKLGVLVSQDGKQELVVADIPGLIEKASQGRGLGNRFLRHIQNCQTLMYVLFLEEAVVFDKALTNDNKAEQVWHQFEQLKRELQDHSQELLGKKYVVTLNKTDLYSEELITAIQARFKKENIQVIPFSGVTGQGLTEITTVIFRLI